MSQPSESRRILPDGIFGRHRGAPRIHGELLKLGIEISQTTVAKYMARGRRPPSQSWRTFLRNHAHDIASIDFFVVPTATCRLLFGLLILRLERRQPVHVGVTTNPTAEWIARQISEAFPWDTAPKYLIRDRDGATPSRADDSPSWHLRIELAARSPLCYHCRRLGGTIWGIPV